LHWQSNIRKRVNGSIASRCAMIYVRYVSLLAGSMAMPKGPKGQKRPADVVGNAVRVMRIATGEAEEEYDTSHEGKDQAAAALGRKGGKARAEKMTAERRAEIARKAASSRWKR
jgi:hypothetical protein